MNDPILDEISRVRRQLVKDHGGIEGYLAYIQKLDRSHRRRLGDELDKPKRQSRVHSQSAR
jgi:hypothetical protein